MLLLLYYTIHPTLHISASKTPLGAVFFFPNAPYTQHPAPCHMHGLAGLKTSPRDEKRLHAEPWTGHNLPIPCHVQPGKLCHDFLPQGQMLWPRVAEHLATKYSKQDQEANAAKPTHHHDSAECSDCGNIIRTGFFHPGQSCWNLPALSASQPTHAKRTPPTARLWRTFSPCRSSSLASASWKFFAPWAPFSCHNCLGLLTSEKESRQ